VDVGANIGLFSLWLCGSTPGARVIAVEPAPPNVDLLVRNLHRAGLSHHIHVVRAALGAASGRGVLHYYPCMPGNSTLLPCVKWRDRVAFRPDRWAAMFARREYPCEVLTLSCVLRAHARVGQEVDLLKIDAEGSEVDVLRGVNEADWPRIWQVAVEVHGDVMRERVTEILASRYAHHETPA
jgi:FkbM family methyltransferase